MSSVYKSRKRRQGLIYGEIEAFFSYRKTKEIFFTFKVHLFLKTRKKIATAETEFDVWTARM